MLGVSRTVVENEVFSSGGLGGSGMSAVVVMVVMWWVRWWRI